MDNRQKQAKNLLDQKEELENKINAIDDEIIEKNLPFSDVEKLYISNKDLNSLYNATPTSINSKQFNPYMKRVMPATYQYGGVTNDLFGGNVNQNNGADNLLLLASKDFTIIQKYLQYLEAQTERVKYNNWPDNFDFTYHDFERMLNVDGLDKNIKLCNYTPTKQNYLNKPIEIQPNFDGVKDEARPNWASKKFEEEDFVVARNNINEISVFPRILRWLMLWEACAYQLEKQSRLMAPKVFTNGNIKLRKANLKEPMNEVMNSEDTFEQIFLPSDVAGRDQMINGTKFQDSLDKLFATIQFEPRVEDYQALISLAKDMINEALGMSINPMSDKSERVNTLEINTQQDLARLTAKHQLEMRREAIDEMNEKFGTNIEIEDEETAYEDSVENTNTGNIDRVENGGEDDE